MRTLPSASAISSSEMFDSRHEVDQGLEFSQVHGHRDSSTKRRTLRALFAVTPRWRQLCGRRLSPASMVSLNHSAELYAVARVAPSLLIARVADLSGREPKATVNGSAAGTFFAELPRQVEPLAAANQHAIGRRRPNSRSATNRLNGVTGPRRWRVPADATASPRHLPRPACRDRNASSNGISTTQGAPGRPEIEQQWPAAKRSQGQPSPFRRLVKRHAAQTSMAPSWSTRRSRPRPTPAAPQRGAARHRPRQRGAGGDDGGTPLHASAFSRTQRCQVTALAAAARVAPEMRRAGRRSRARSWPGTRPHRARRCGPAHARARRAVRPRGPVRCRCRSRPAGRSSASSAAFESSQ